MRWSGSVMSSMTSCRLLIKEWQLDLQPWLSELYVEMVRVCYVQYVQLLIAEQRVTCFAYKWSRNQIASWPEIVDSVQTFYWGVLVLIVVSRYFFVLWIEIVRVQPGRFCSACEEKDGWCFCYFGHTKVATLATHCSPVCSKHWFTTSFLQRQLYLVMP